MMQMTTSPNREIRHYPNVIELWQDGTKVIAYTPEEWAVMVQFVGIRSLAPCPPDRVRLPAADALT